MVWMQVCFVSMLAVFQDATLTALDYSMDQGGMLNFTYFMVNIYLKMTSFVGRCYVGGLIGDLTSKDAHSYDDVYPCIIFQ